MLILRDRRALAGACLVLVLLWAVAAVILLASTTTSAANIDDHARDITQQTSGIDHDLNAIGLARRTRALAARILQAARPLAPTTTALVRATGRTKSIANGISRTVTLIALRVDDIGVRVGSIARAVTVVGEHVRAIRGTAAAIRGVFARLAPTVDSIRAGIARASSQATAVTSRVAAVDGRLAGVLDQLGSDPGNPVDAGIAGHANSVDCRVLGSDCHREQPAR